MKRRMKIMIKKKSSLVFRKKIEQVFLAMKKNG
jgi:hypothetical protein